MRMHGLRCVQVAVILAYGAHAQERGGATECGAS